MATAASRSIRRHETHFNHYPQGLAEVQGEKMQFSRNLGAFGRTFRGAAGESRG
jgi:hypothetical protein